MKTTLKILILFILCLLIWEIILRNTTYGPTGFIDHDVLGKIYKKGTYVHGSEGYSRSKFNSLGFRGSELTDRNPGLLRILALGDSYTEALQVNEKYTFCNLVKINLSKKLDQNVEVINAGRSSASPAYYIHLSEFYINTVSPDAVIIQLNKGDISGDFYDSYNNFYVVRNNSGFSTVQNKNFISNMPFIQKHPAMSIIFDSAVLRLGYFKIQKSYRLRIDKQTPQSPQVPSDYRDRIKWMLSSFKEHYEDPIVWFIPDIDFYNDNNEFSVIETELETASNHIGINYLNTRNALYSYYRKNKQTPVGFNNTSPWKGHLNPEGHRVVAELLTERILKHINR